MDARTSEPRPGAEKPGLPVKRPEQLPPPEHPRAPSKNDDQTPPPKADEQSKQKQDDQKDDHGKKPKGSWRDTLREHRTMVIVGASLLLLVAIGALAYWLAVRNYESTDDAFVTARQFSIAPKVGGYVTAVPVTDNQHVNTGDLVAQIDERDYKIAVEQAAAQVSVAQANIDNVKAQIDSQYEQVKEAKAQVEQAKAQFEFAKEEEGRAKDLVEKGAGTVQREQQTRSDLQSQEANMTRSNAALTAAELGIKTLGAQLESANASLQQSQAQLDQANLNLGYTHVTAAQAGRVVRLAGAVGTFVSPGQAISTFVPDDIWVVANFKETQLRDMRPGQPVEFRIDAYPNRKLTGHVASVQPGSGTAFSLLPAENATGNYVKIVQRVPVKIVVDQWPADVSIGPGMSVVPWVKVR